METQQVTVLGETVTIKGMSYSEYVHLTKEVVKSNIVSPTDREFNDFVLLQLFALILALTGKSLMNTATAFIQSLEKPSPGVV